MASSPSEASELEFAFPPSGIFEPDPSGSRSSDEFVDGEWTKLCLQTSHHSNPNDLVDTDSQHESAPHHRASPMPSAIRFSQQSHKEHSGKSRIDSWLSRRSSVHSPNPPPPATQFNVNTHGHSHSINAKLKGKERSIDSSESSPLSSSGYAYTYGYGTDQFVSSFTNTSASFTSQESSLRITPIPPSQAQPRKQRASILIAATDALGLRKKLGSVSRKKPPSTQISRNNGIPDVIEISAHHSDLSVTTTVAGTTAHMDREHEERERLRGAAAQSIGIDPDLLHQPLRSHSLSSCGSSEPQEFPPFPATLGTLRSVTQMSATFPKYSPASSLLVYALAKQWKYRTLVLTSHATGHRTHVHLFKGASPGEIEIERLEITEHSAMFVVDEEVGGRRRVIKLVGNDVGMKKSGSTSNNNNSTGGSSEDPFRAMWHFQITDPAESQRWIASIKNAVLSKRSLRAGLGLPVSNSTYGPRGDMDVMLSMRMQGMISPQPPKKASVSASSKTSSPSPPPSLRSLAVNMPSLPAASGFKNLFPGSRSRSPSLDASHSPVVPQSHAEESFGVMGTSLLTMFRGNTGSDTSSSPSLSLPLPHAQKQGSPAASIRSASTTVALPADLRITKDRDIHGSPPSSPTPGPMTSPITFQSITGTVPLSLLPPPRRLRCTPTAPIPIPIKQEGRDGLYKHPNGNRSVAGSFGIRPAESLEPPPPLPPMPGIGVVPPGADEPRRIPSGEFTAPPLPDADPSRSSSSVVNLQPVSPVVSAVLPLFPESPPASAGNGMLEVPATPESRSRSSSTSKRWSRMVTSLPQRPDPPSGPPPSVPAEAPPALQLHVPHPYAADGPPSTTSSNSRTDTSLQSTSSPAPSFWKRVSSSSAYSVESWSTSGSRAVAEPTTTLGSPTTSLSPPTNVVAPDPPPRSMSLDVPRTTQPASKVVAAKRRSMPPPRPAPTHAPPPAPVASLLPPLKPSSAPQPQKLFRTSVAQRALRLSLTSPKPPPSSGLPLRPDELGFVPGHRRSSSNSTIEVGRPSSELPAIPGSPPRSPSRTATPNHQRPSSSASIRSVSLKQRLRILGGPSTASSSSPSARSIPSPPTPSQFDPPRQHHTPIHVPASHTQAITLDFDNDDDDNDPSIPSHDQPEPRRPPFGLGEHIMNIRNDPSFLSLSTPDSPTIPRPPRSPFRPGPIGSTTPGTPIFEGEFEFMSLSPPPPRRGSKQLSVTVVHTERGAGSDLPAVSETESSNLEGSTPAALAARASVVSLGFITR